MLKTSGDPATLTHTPPAPPGFPLCNSLDLCGFCTSYSHSHSHMIFIPFSCRSQLNKLSILVYFSCDANKIKDCFLFLVFVVVVGVGVDVKMKIQIRFTALHTNKSTARQVVLVVVCLIYSHVSLLLSAFRALGLSLFVISL